MRKQAVIRNRRNKKKEKGYLFVASRDVWKEIEDLTGSLDMSVAYFLRESVRRNLAAYRKSQVH